MTIRFSETDNGDYDPDGIAGELKTLMQVNRLHKYLSARVCEFIFVLRKCYSLVKNDIIGKLFGKKNPFQEIEIPSAPQSQVSLKPSQSAAKELSDSLDEANASPLNR